MPKKPVDANKPRGPITAYALFVRTCRDELRRKYPQLTVDYNVISKKCSERWKVMNENEKRRFNETADLQRKRYKEELATYQQEQLARQQQQQPVPSSILLQAPATQYLIEPSQQQQQHTMLIPTPVQHALVTAPKKPAKKRKPKDPLAPKKPLSAYFLFCADERPKVLSLQAGMSVSDVARELGVRWKSTSVELKGKYEQAASEKKHVYQAEMALYKHQTSTGSSPPETPQTPLTLHDYQSTFTSLPIQQSMQLQYDLNENPSDFDLMADGDDEPL